MNNGRIPCVACGGKLKTFGSREGYSYYVCEGCCTLQLVPMPDEKELVLRYENEYCKASHYEQDPITCTRGARPYYESIRDILTEYKISGPVLDCGAGWGGLCRLLIESGFDCRGVEPSAVMADYCLSQGLPVLHGGLERFDGDRFSAIVLCTVFEHLTSHLPWLEKARSLISPGGFLITLQPTARFACAMGRIARLGRKEAPLPRLHQVFCPPWHTAFFSLQGMKKLAGIAGFEAIEVRPAPQGSSGGAVGMMQWMLEKINKLGWFISGIRWPLLVAHTFILRRD
jgi:SAM-dependent methyltransferase